ncbi:MAG TPA: ankyrin repeat domain-containing protein [Bryobacteraceae bacterium]|nr:ankyrin repeat domain-containing protein [Bryobacteraceae bacterium]
MRQIGLVFFALLSAGCGLRQNTPTLVGASRDGRVDLIPVLIKQGADPNQRSGVNGWTPLMHAIHTHQKGSVIALLDNGADVNARGDGGSNPLLMAAGYGYTDIVNILLDRGADAHAQLQNGDNALTLAILGVSDIDRFTLGDCQDSTVRALLERAPDLHLKNSPAAAAKAKGCAGVAKLLGVRYP